jgi:hypothetical protein
MKVRLDALEVYVKSEEAKTSPLTASEAEKE